MKEQEIKEMAKEMCINYGHCSECNLRGIDKDDTCSVYIEAEALYNAGYRKQEWISIEDKFPDVDKILGWDGTAMWFVDAKGICESLQNVISKNGITHWLPIPKPPKMKGGEE